MKERPWVPRILRPDHTWPCPLRPSPATPPVPRVTRPLVRRLWGYMHRLLRLVSLRYMAWFGVGMDSPGLHQLPFGLVLKWHERTRVEEAVATQMVRAGGLPAPRVLCYGEHPGSPFRVSILMTRLPGTDLYAFYRHDDPFAGDAEGPWFGELRRCVDAMRAWQHPAMPAGVCSATGTAVASRLVPNHRAEPTADAREFTAYLLSAAWPHGYEKRAEYDRDLAVARRLYEMPHRIVWTQGDFKWHNFLLDDDGHLSGFLDWEGAGWYPEHWEFVTGLRGSGNAWWNQVVNAMGGERYAAEMECDWALSRLTANSWGGW